MMATPPRSRTEIVVSVTSTLTEVALSGAQLAAAAGISPARLAALVRLGIVEPVGGPDEFTAATARRLRRLLRLERDLDVDVEAAAVIMDLLERLDRLEAELARARGGG
jgi:chaperone modulatory protein CbpM